jgi:hypothetical protein
MTTLAIPMFLAAVGIIFRGTAFALRGHAATIREARFIGATFALSSVLVPFCFGAAIGGIASGRVPVGNQAGDTITSWLNPTSVLIGVLAVLSGAYLGGGLPRRRRGPRRGARPRAGLPGARAGRRRRDRRGRAGRPVRDPLGLPRAVRRARRRAAASSRCCARPWPER